MPRLTVVVRRPPAPFNGLICNISLIKESSRSGSFLLLCSASFLTVMFGLFFLYVMFGLIFLYVVFGLGVDSWRERAISEVRGLRDERGPTQLGIYTRQSRDPRVKPEDDKKESTRG